MRKKVLLFFLIVSFISTQSQQSLSDSRQTSVQTYIYQITTKEAKVLFESGMEKFGEQFLHTTIDSFLTSTEEAPQLEKGNYLFVHASGNRLVGELTIVDDLQYKLLNNNRDLTIILNTKSGQPITNSTVFINKKKIPFDPDLQAFRLDKRKRSGTISIYHGGVLHQFTLERNNNQQNFWQKLGNSFPLKYIVQPVRGWFENRDRYYYYFENKAKYEKKFTGFMVFSKPIYKPSDTVRLKAFILNKKKHPIDRPLLLRITDRNFLTDSIIAVIKPYRPGTFEYDFVINDSLDLTLDNKYLLTLEELSSRKYNLDEYDGDLEEDEYALQRKILIRGKFEYEEYELSSVTFTARSDKKDHNRHDLVSLYLKATDENGMAVLDGRVQVLIKPSEIGAVDFYNQNVFIPDTLWYHTQPLEPLGETKITLPDSLFPAASLGYEIECIFLSSNNERQTQSLWQHYDYDPYKILIEQKFDSLFISQLNGNKPEMSTAIIYALNDNDDTISQRSLHLPGAIKINPFASYYEVETGSSFEEYKLGQTRGMVRCVALRTKDSVSIQVINPNKLFFWYTLFAGNKVIKRGHTDNLFFTEKSRTNRNYFVSLQYIYGNNTITEDYTAAYKDKILTVEAAQPPFVYPGQTTDIIVKVTNAAGNPVPDADVTAYAFTKKFKNVNPPFIPYLGKKYPGRNRFPNFTPGKKEDEELEGSIILNWQKWSKEMGLDSIEYFRFLHTPTIYRNVEPAKDNITQVAPFVVINGELQPVHQIYIDERPVFFSQSQQLQRYSFYVQPGKHSFRMRTNHYMVKVDSIWATAGSKTFFAINADTTVNKMIQLIKMPDSLTNYEKNLWSKYMLLIENNFGENYSYIAQKNMVSLINYSKDRNQLASRNILVGPLPEQYATLVVKNKFEQEFVPEGNYLFSVTKGLIKQRQLTSGNYSFHSFLYSNTPVLNFKDFVLTKREVDSLWEEYLDQRSANEDLFRNRALNREDNGWLTIRITYDRKKTLPFIKSILLFRNDDPDFVRVYKGSTRSLGYLQPGSYRLFLLLKGDNYYIKDSLIVRRNGTNYYAIENITELAKDSLSSRVAAVVNSRELEGGNNSQGYDLNNISESFNEKFLDSSRLTRTVFGQVKEAKSGTPLVAVTITIKSTRIGTVSDKDGYFKLKVPPRGTLVINSVGYQTVEKRLGDEDNYEIKLFPSTNNLNEVVVTAFGVNRNQKSLGFSVSSVGDELNNGLYGRASGVSIVARGMSIVNGDKPPLILVDGLPYSGDFSKLDTSLIASINIVKDNDARALFGSAAANGVIIITTKRNIISKALTTGGDSPMPGNSVRRNFKDEAFWYPRLRTNAEGKTSFKVTYPDDITSWRTYFIAIAGKETGFAEQQVKSFKLLSTSLTAPQFLISGDSVNIIGKVLNYTMDSFTVQRTFTVNNNIPQQKNFVLKNAWVDTFSVKAGIEDSLVFSYRIQKTDGYFDGEERRIPIFKQGVLETKGFFAVLEKDTSFSFEPGDTASSIKMYAEASLIPVLLDEMESIRKYEYLCNEQLASKLKALLLKKRVYQFLKKEFKEDKNIKELIGKLHQGRSQAGLWGWWDNNEVSLWISLHVTEALLEAQAAGYEISVNKNMVIDFLVLNLESYRGVEKLLGLRLLKLLQAKVNFTKYIDEMEKHTTEMNLYEKLELLLLKEELGMPVAIDTLANKYNTTLFGNIYWGEENYRFLDNSVQNTLLMYLLMRKQGGYETQLQKVRNYFLEKRKNGQWRNTYESSLILETILPDLLKNDSLPKSSSLRINSSGEIHSFPYSIEMKAGGKIHINKQGDLPIYFTAYQQYWNSSPLKVSADFTVNSFFETNGEKDKGLKAGQPIILKVKVSVKGDADYLMIEIPIPAGCSYKDKAQSLSNNEVHREYLRNRVSIFCRNLQKGEYIFNVSLLPRYTGQYLLNPAKAEMMYFPVFYGREEIKRIDIR